MTTHTVSTMSARQCAFVVLVNRPNGHAEVTERYRSELEALMGAPVDDRSESLNGGTRGKRQTDLREKYGQRSTSTTTVGVGPLGTFGAFLGTHEHSDAPQRVSLQWRAQPELIGPQLPTVVVEGGPVTHLARSIDGQHPAMSRAQRARKAGKAGKGRSGRKATCLCGTCRKCIERVKRAERRARAATKDTTTGRAIATTY